MSWQIGIATGACTNLPILHTLPAIYAAGAHGVEVGTPPGHFDPWHVEQVESLVTALAQYRLAPVSLHAPFGGLLDFADPNPHHRHAAIGAALTSAAAIRRLGGRLIVVHPSDLPQNAHDVPARLAAAIRSLTLLADNCAQAGLTLLVETPLPHLVGGRPEDFAYIVNALPASVGVCLDTGHAELAGNWHRLVDIAGARLRHVHAHDNHGTHDDHLPPGEGRLNWVEIVASLRRVRYDGWIMLELACPGQRPLDRYFQQAYERAISLLAP